MGKVIKGSAESEERFTLAVPRLVSAAPPRPDFDAFAYDENEPFGAPPVFEPPPPAPTIDLEALHAQAAEIIDAAELRAQALVDEAQVRVRGLLDDAAARAQVLADEARRSAHDDGHAAGVHEADAAMAGMLDTMRQLVDAARDQRHTLLGSAEPELVRLAVGIAERVLHQQIALDPGVVVEMAKAAISRLVDRETITVRVNPADLEQMRGHRDELLALGDVKTMRVIEDQRVDRGGVLLETDAGSIDAKISTQLNEVRKILHIVDDVVVQPAGHETPASDETSLTASRAS